MDEQREKAIKDRLASKWYLFAHGDWATSSECDLRYCIDQIEQERSENRRLAWLVEMYRIARRANGLCGRPWHASTHARAEMALDRLGEPGSTPWHIGEIDGPPGQFDWAQLLGVQTRTGRLVTTLATISGLLTEHFRTDKGEHDPRIRRVFELIDAALDAS